MGEKPDAVAPHVRFDERRLETEPRSEMRHRHLAKAAGQQQLLATYSHRASRRLFHGTLRKARNTHFMVATAISGAAVVAGQRSGNAEFASGFFLSRLRSLQRLGS
jgi:hypothetical protein